MLFTDLTTAEEMDAHVRETFGAFDHRSQVFDFAFTSYYNDEMGAPIHRLLYSVAELVDPGDLSRFKSAAIAFERRTACPDGRRIVNMDPGILSLSRLILATTKASGHRIPIGSLLWAEITLLYQHGSYRPLEWTYPDFRSDIYAKWLLEVRTAYHAQLRALDPERNWRL